MKALTIFSLLISLSFQASAYYPPLIWINPSCPNSSDGYIAYDFNPGPLGTSVAYPLSFIWSTGSTSSSISNLPAGTYSVTWTEADGTTNDFTVTLYSPPNFYPSPQVTSPSSFSSNDGSICINSAYEDTLNYLVEWSNGELGICNSNLPYGTYHLSISHWGCTYLDSFLLIPPAPAIQEIRLNQGWNLISLNKEPLTTTTMDIFEDISDNIIQMKSWDGLSWLPSLGLNQISSFELEYGYWIKMSEADTLYVSGDQINPPNTTISLPLGWCIIGYNRYAPGLSTDLFSPIESSLIIMKDGEGAVYWPQYNVNLLDPCVSGDAYQIKMSSPMQFTYPSNEESLP